MPRRLPDASGVDLTTTVGSITLPAPVMTALLRGEVVSKIFAPTVQTMAEMGMPYSGVLYAGLMLTREGPKYIVTWLVQDFDVDYALQTEVLLGEWREGNKECFQPSFCNVLKADTSVRLGNHLVESAIDCQAKKRCDERLGLEITSKDMLVQNRWPALPDERSKGSSRRARPTN